MALLTLGALAMIAAVWWYYRRERAAVEAATVRELSAISRMESAQIERWRAENLAAGNVLAASQIMQPSRRILAGAGDAAARVEVSAFLDAYQREYVYSSAVLVDLQGTVRLGSSAGMEASPEYGVIVQQTQRAGKPILSDLYKRPSGKVRMSLSLPVADLGAIVLNINPSKNLYTFLAYWPTVSHTGEATLIRRDGDYVEALSELRHVPGSALNFRIRAPRGIPSDLEMAAGWVRLSRDYFGVPCLAMIRHVQDSNWYLSTKVDAAEVYAPLTRLSWELALVVALIAIANAAGVGYIWRNQQLHAYIERRALDGHFDSLARHANDIIMLADDRGRIVESNRRAVETFGYTEAEMKSLYTFQLRADVPGQPPVWPSRELELGTRYEAILRRKDGATFPAEISARMIDVEGIRFCQAIIRDISERVRTEKEIKALSARLIAAQEEERRRLARDLHDDISQQIAALSIGMSNLRKHIPAEQTEAREQSKRIQQNMAQVAESIRRLSHELHPAVLEHSGLAAALRGYCSEFGLLTNIRVACKTEGSFASLPAEVALCVFRVTQEALQNVAKHARVAEAELRLVRAGGWLSLTVSDRGAGMVLNCAGQPSGLGLVSIKERTRLVNGTFHIDSGPSRGTVLNVKIPV